MSHMQIKFNFRSFEYILREQQLIILPYLCNLLLLGRVTGHRLPGCLLSSISRANVIVKRLVVNLLLNCY